MSTSTSTENRSARRSAEHAPPATPPKAEGTGNGQTGGTLGNVTIEIADMEITLPVKFGPGHALTENQAKVLDAAYQRQFTNNQNASAKSRAEAYGKATTDAERNAKLPLTAAQIAELYTDYEPSVGGTPRQSTMERLRHEAAWRMWTALVAAHNANATKNGANADYAPVISKAGKGQVNTAFRAVKSTDGKTVVSTAQDQKDSFTGALLGAPRYALAIQDCLDAILAERGAKKPEATSDTVVASGSDLL